MSPLLALLGVLSPAPAATPGTEFVLVIDNSCSMVETHSVLGLTSPPADPDRRAVLGALIVEGLTRGTPDELTVLAFPVRERVGVLEVSGARELRELPPSNGTFYAGPISRARQILSQSDRDSRMLLFLSDGQPNDLTSPELGRKMLGLPPLGADAATVPWDTLVLGLLPGPDPAAEDYLRQLAKHPEDYVRVEDGASLVSHFTRGAARALGSRALDGTSKAGGEQRIEVGRYVTELLAVTTTVGRSGPYTAVLSGPPGVVPIRASGDNGCQRSPAKNPTYCAPPRLHYAVWRTQNDPERASTWTLSVPRAGGDVAWGVILRYDLDAEAIVPETAAVDEPTRIRARLMFRGAPVDDADFFSKDGFRAEARVRGQRVELAHVGGGAFEGDWTPRDVGENGVEVVFQNTWMEKRARARVQVEQPIPLALTGPEALDFGRWRGGRRSTQSCLPFQVAANRPIGELTFAFDLPDDVRVTVSPAGNGHIACLVARGCCGDLVSPSDASFTVDAQDARGAGASTAIRVRYHVDRTGFLRCWWPWLVALIALVVVLWFLYGWIRPHDFDEDLTIKVAGSERQLARAASLVLREQPRGRRGFYRNARVAITATGDFVAHPRNAAVWIEAVGRGETRIHLRGPLEVRDRRTKKWERVTDEQAADGVKTQEIYRLGDILIRFQ